MKFPFKFQIGDEVVVRKDYNPGLKAGDKARVDGREVRYWQKVGFDGELEELLCVTYLLVDPKRGWRYSSSFFEDELELWSNP